MKKEVAFFKDKRGGFSAKNLIALYRSLGYTDAQIKDEMLKIKAAQQSVQPTAAGGSDSGENSESGGG